jgi:transposase
LRQERSKPLMDELGAAIARIHQDALPKSVLGKATTYAINQWDTLRVFLDDPRIPLSNAHVERQQRLTALGRKNYLFSGSDEGAKRLATLQTFAVLCELADVSLFEYLRDVIGKLADGWLMSRLPELLPSAWAKQKAKELDAQAA